MGQRKGYTWGKILRSARTDLRFSLEKMARVLGVSSCSLSLYECGHRRVDPGILEVLRDIGVDLHSEDTGRIWRYGFSKELAAIKADALENENISSEN
jgi:transcriptional regulator with XRE-family HTH domain